MNGDFKANSTFRNVLVVLVMLYQYNCTILSVSTK